jgi:hypothetical protein
MSKINERLLWTQIVSFSLVYFAWSMPGLIVIRNTFLIIGIIVGLLMLQKSLKKIYLENTFSINLLAMLFIWVTIHLFFFGKNEQLQYHEYTSIWKRCFIGSMFGLSFGYIMNNGAKSSHWKSITIIINIPIFFFIIKYIYTKINQINGTECITENLDSICGYLSFYLPKTVYIIYCIPQIAIFISLIYISIVKECKNIEINKLIYYIVSILMSIFIIISLEIFNGIIYSLIIFLYFIMALVLFNFKGMRRIFYLMIIASIITSQFFIYKNQILEIKDAIVAVKNTNNENSWKNFELYGFPKNENNVEINGKFYSRLAWSYEAIKLIFENPLGYGLIENSFGRIAKTKWSESNLTQSHSGWLDLTLGMGIPFVTMLVMLLIRCSWGLVYQNSIYKLPILMGLASYYLIFISVELSQKVFIDMLIFYISWCVGITLRIQK